MPKRWPSEETLKKMDKKLIRAESAATLSPDASAIERFKFEIGDAFVMRIKIRVIRFNQSTISIFHLIVRGFGIYLQKVVIGLSHAVLKLQKKLTELIIKVAELNKN